MTADTTASGPAGTGPRLAHADAAVSAGERILHHAQIETLNDIDAVMGTVTPAGTLSWAGTWAWSAPAVRPDGTVKVAVHTTLEGIRGFYLDNRSRYQVTSIGRPYVRICSDWYALMETQAQFASVPDRVPYEQRWVLLAPMDGTEGITGELTWGLFPQLAPGAEVTEDVRAGRYHAYLEALRGQDVDGLLALMSPGVQGAVRDGVDEARFTHIDGADAMRSHYEALFAAVRVRAVDPVQFTERGWYLFTELRWRVEVVTGPRSGLEGSLLTAEIMPLDKDGRIYARLGFGTGLLV